MRLTRRSLVLAAAAAATLVPASTAIAHDDHGGHDRARNLLRAPIAGSLPTDPPIFGVAPGGAPWVVDRGSARVRTDGRIDVRVEGLVIPTAPANGTNPVPRLSASLACNGMVVATTRTVPFSRAGNARIHQNIRIPKRCIAPVVMLNPNGIKTVFIGITGTEE
jgi:hypothetical protein